MRGKSKSKAPILVLLFLLATILPTEFGFYAGTLRISVYRLLLIVVTIPLMIKLFSGPPDKRFNWADGLMLFHVFWVFIAIASNHGLERAVESGGIYFVEVMGAYLIGRLYVSSISEYMSTVKLLFAFVFVLCLFAVPEMVSGKHIIREISSKLMGASFYNTIDKRWGLARAYTTFEHPILYGVFVSSIFAMCLYHNRYTSKLKRYWQAFIVALATFTCLSSGALVALIMQMILSGWDRLTTVMKIRQKWWVLFGIFMIFYALIDVLSNRSPMRVFLSYLTFSPHTAYNRLIIWDWGTEEVKRYPMFGIGFDDWTRPEWMHSTSMDNFWLVVAVRYGLPALVPLMIVFFSTMRGSWKPDVRMPPSAGEHMHLGYSITMFSLFVAGSTVHYWNANMVFLFFLIGIGVGMKASRNVRVRVR